MSRYAHRPYKERIALEADDFIKAIRKGEVDIDYAHELERQQAIAEVLGIGRTPADADRVKALLFDGVDTGYGVKTGAQLQGRGRLGIDGDYKSDSTVRLHRSELDGVDPLLADDVKNRALTDGYLGIETEYLSPKTTELLERRSGKSTAAFNRVLGEYYGQQALKLSGAQPVEDQYRSSNVRYHSNHPNSTLGTNRLIETQRSVMGRDVGAPAGDYRYVDAAGNLHVGDYQVATYGPHHRDVPIKLQMVKESSLPVSAQARFAGALQDAAKGKGDIDAALQVLLQQKELPPLMQGSVKGGGREIPREGYSRAGKMTSDGEYMGVLNKDIYRGGQHRYDNVVFGIQSAANLNQTGGGVPRGYYQVDARKAREYLADLGNSGLLAQEIRIGTDGSVYTNAGLSDLINAGVALDMVKASPAVRQLL